MSFPGGSKNPPAMQETQETWVPSLGQEDPLEEEMAVQSSMIAWEIPRTEGPGSLQSTSHKELDMTEQLSMHTHINVLLTNSRIG